MELLLIKFTLLKCTVLQFLVYHEVVQPSPYLIFEHFTTPKINASFVFPALLSVLGHQFCALKFLLADKKLKGQKGLGKLHGPII